MRREAKLLIFLLSYILYKCVDTHVEQQWAEAVPLESTYTHRNGRSSIFISYNGCMENYHKDWILRLELAAVHGGSKGLRLLNCDELYQMHFLDRERLSLRISALYVPC